MMRPPSPHDVFVSRVAAARDARLADPAWRPYARCETGAIGGMGECLLCDADQGEQSPACIAWKPS